MATTAPGRFKDIKTADQKGRITLGLRYAGRRFAVQEQPDGTAILTPVLVMAQADSALLTREHLQERFASLENMADNWDGCGSLAPKPETIGNAKEVLALLQASALARQMTWTDPHIGVNERGQITLEWWWSAVAALPTG